jgi:hypothetical protein
LVAKASLVCVECFWCVFIREGEEMQNRFGASNLEGRGYISILAAVAVSLLSVAVGALAGVALAQGEGGDVNIHASDCSQVQAIFIQQFYLDLVGEV